MATLKNSAILAEAWRRERAVEKTAGSAQSQFGHPARSSPSHRPMSVRSVSPRPIGDRVGVGAYKLGGQSLPAIRSQFRAEVVTAILQTPIIVFVSNFELPDFERE